MGDFQGVDDRGFGGAVGMEGGVDRGALVTDVGGTGPDESLVFVEDVRRGRGSDGVSPEE